MATQRETNKRRVTAARRAEAQRKEVARKDRRKRLILGGVVGFLALALIAPLTAGLLLNDTPTTTTTSTTTLPDFPWVSEVAAGAAIEGATPCPATDGTAERTTSFETAPPMCIDEDAKYELAFTIGAESGAQDFLVPVDASLAPVAANLAVTFALYHTYEQTTAAILVEGGLLWLGGDGDAGFTVPGGVATGEDPYPIGSVVMVAGLQGELDGIMAVVLDDVASALLAADPRHVVIGHVDDVAALAALNDGPVTAVSATEVT